jgi:hypothetical protein
MRRTFAYGVELAGIGEIFGSYIADCGDIDLIELPDGEEVTMDLRGNASHRSPLCRALAEAVYRELMSSPAAAIEQIAATQPHEDWSSYAPATIWGNP